MESINAITRNKFLPVITTYTISDPDVDFEEMVHDPEMLFERFRKFQLDTGMDTLMIMGDGTYIAEAFGCDMTYKKREPFIASNLPIETEEDAMAVEIPEVECCGRISALFEAIRMAKKAVGDDVPILTNSPGAFTSVARTLGMTETFMNLIMKPEVVKIMIDKVAEYTRNYTDAVIEAGAAESGVTVHLVDEEYDHGKIIAQKKVKVRHRDTAKTLAKRVLKVEHDLYPKVVKAFCKDRVVWE